MSEVTARTLAKRRGSMEEKMVDTFLQQALVNLTLPGTLGFDAGLGSDGVHLGEFTAQAVGGAVADDGAVTTDETTEANEATTDDMTLLPATPAVNDAYYIGHLTKKFCAVKLIQSTGGAGTWTIVVEYWNGTAWATLTLGLDEIADFTTGAATYLVTFEPPADWATTAVKAITGYWIRWRVSAYTSVTTQPLGARAYVYTVEDGNGMPMPVSGTISNATFTCGTKSGSTADTKFLLVNLTQGTWDTITYTKAKGIDQDATVSLDVAEDDELVLLQLTEDGTTEYATVDVALKITQ